MRNSPEDNYKFKGRRKTLVKTVRSKGIRDKYVLEALENIPRHFFFEAAFYEHAYDDKAFPIGEGQTISQPYTVAKMTELLDVKEGQKVLEIGTGSGYQASVLAYLGVKLYSIEYHKKLYLRAKEKLEQMNLNAHLMHGDGSKGVEAFAPYDRIIVTAGAPTAPNALLDQLKVGGILVIPEGDKEVQKMYKYEKSGENKVIKEYHGDFRFVPLVGEQGWAG